MHRRNLSESSRIAALVFVNRNFILNFELGYRVWWMSLSVLTLCSMLRIPLVYFKWLRIVYRFKGVLRYICDSIHYASSEDCTSGSWSPWYIRTVLESGEFIHRYVRHVGNLPPRGQSTTSLNSGYLFSILHTTLRSGSLWIVRLFVLITANARWFLVYRTRSH